MTITSTQITYHFQSQPLQFPRQSKTRKVSKAAVSWPTHRIAPLCPSSNQSIEPRLQPLVAPSQVGAGPHRCLGPRVSACITNAALRGRHKEGDSPKPSVPWVQKWMCFILGMKCGMGYLRFFHTLSYLVVINLLTYSCIPTWKELYCKFNSLCLFLQT